MNRRSEEEPEIIQTTAQLKSVRIIGIWEDYLLKLVWKTRKL